MRDEAVRVQLEPAAHAIELQHGRDAIRFFEANVLDVLQNRLALRERTQRRQNRQHVRDVAAIDAHAAQLDAVVFHPDGARVRIVRHRKAHLAHDVQERALGMVRKLTGQLLQASEEHVGGMDRRDREPERGRADVGRKLDVVGRACCPGSTSNRRQSGATRTCRSNARIISTVRCDVRPFVQLAFDLDDRSLFRERREQQEARRSIATAFRESRSCRRAAFQG